MEQNTKWNRQWEAVLQRKSQHSFMALPPCWDRETEGTAKTVCKALPKRTYHTRRGGTAPWSGAAREPREGHRARREEGPGVERGSQSEENTTSEII